MTSIASHWCASQVQQFLSLISELLASLARCVSVKLKVLSFVSDWAVHHVPALES